MKITYIHQYFATPEEGGAIRSYHLAKGLVEAGIEVEMITAHNAKNYVIKDIAGIKVHYLPVYYDHSLGFSKRSIAFFKFVRQAKSLLKKLERPQIMYVTSTPLTTGLIGLWAKRQLGIPFIFEVRDLWPEAPIQVGAIQNFFLKKALYKLENKIYEQAMTVVALSPGIRQYIQRSTSENKVCLIPNFSDTYFFKPCKVKPNQLLHQLNWKEKSLTITYTGAIGEVNAVHELLELAELAIRKGKNWQFGIMGKGKHLQKIQRKIKELKLSNVKLLPFGNKEKVRELLSISDISFVSFERLPILQTNSPNKFFDALAMGNAVMVNHSGWINTLVQNHQLGLEFDIDQLSEVFGQLEVLERNRKKLLRMKKNARSLAELYFSKEIAIDRLLHILDPQRYPRPSKNDVFMLIP